MAEFNNKTDEELRQEIREVEAQMARNRQMLTRVAKEGRDYDRQIEMFERQLKPSIAPPHLVSTIGEILELEESDEEADFEISQKKQTK